MHQDSEWWDTIVWLNWINPDCDIWNLPNYPEGNLCHLHHSGSSFQDGVNGSKFTFTPQKGIVIRTREGGRLSGPPTTHALSFLLLAHLRQGMEGYTISHWGERGRERHEGIKIGHCNSSITLVPPWRGKRCEKDTMPTLYNGGAMCCNITVKAANVNAMKIKNYRRI